MKRSKKKTQEIIHILPPYEGEVTPQASHDHFYRCVEYAKTVVYVPASLEELRRIDSFDFKLRMDYNPRFYNAAIALCDEMITQMIKDAKKFVSEEYECDALEDVNTLEDLINSGFFGDNPDYDERRYWFICTLMDCYLYAA